MDHLFDEDINPMIDKATASIDAAVDHVGVEVNATADHITAAIKSIIADAAETASALADNVTKDVEKIISDGSAAVQQAEKTFFQDASKLLAQINAIVKKIQCTETAVAKQLQDSITKLLKQLNPWYRASSCWRGLGYSITRSLEDLTEIELYNYQKTCTLLNKITPSTPIEGPNGIKQIYAQGQLYAAQYFCIGESAGSPAFEDVFTKEWVWWGVQYNKWNKGTTKPAGRLGKTKDGPCKTPVECYQQAIAKLEEARAEIHDKASESELQSAEKLLEAKANTTQVDWLSQQVSSQASQISSQSQTLSDLSTKVNGLEISEDCRDDATAFDSQGGGNVYYLDRHNPSCYDDERMVEWRLERNDPNTEIRIDYRCCKMTVSSSVIVV